MGLVAPRHVGSSQTRARTRVPCVSRQILNYCATREALFSVFLILLLSSFLLLFIFPIVVWWFSLVLIVCLCFFLLVFLCIYCMFLVCGYHGVCICCPITISTWFKLIIFQVQKHSKRFTFFHSPLLHFVFLMSYLTSSCLLFFYYLL